MKNKKVLIIIITSIVLLLFGVVASAIVLINSNHSRTVMIYMVGSDLESGNPYGLASIDLKSIDYNKIKNNNVNVVMIAGGAKKWNNTYISSNETSIFELKENGFQKVKQQEVKNMGKDQTLSEFLSFVHQNYKTHFHNAFLAS